MDTRRTWKVTAVALLGVALLGAACGESAPTRSAETLAVEAEAGDFLDYYEEVLRLAKVYAAYPDSFQAALDSLPGSHLTEEQWKAWTTPYEDDPARLADRLDEVITELARNP